MSALRLSPSIDVPRARPTASLPSRDMSGLRDGSSAATEARRPAVLGVQPASQAEAPASEPIEGYPRLHGMTEAALFHAYRNASSEADE